MIEVKKLLDPKNDVVFQKLFGVKENEKLLISFLNSILEPGGDGRIKSVTIEEKNITASLIASEKLSILDINVTTEDNTHINVEMQLVNQYNMVKRTIYYLSKIIAKQLEKGDNYTKLNKTITINILDFNYLKGENFHSSYKLYEDITKNLLTDLIEIRFIELKKFAEGQKDYNKKLHRWLSFLLDPKGREIDTLKKEDNEIREAVDVLYKISGNEDVIQLADLREKAIKDEISRLQGAKAEGKAEGIKEGIKEGIEEGKKLGAQNATIENAMSLLKLGVDIEIVAKGTGLTVHKVEELYKKIKNKI